MSSPSVEIVDRLRAAGCVFAEDEAALLVGAAATPDGLAAMVERRVAGEPLEHVLGWAEFCGLRVVVEPGVFVPRPRTAFLIEQAVALARRIARMPVLLDLCCGTGAMAAAIAAELGGISGGVTGGISGGVSGGVLGEVSRGVSGGVFGGVSGGVAGGVSSGVSGEMSGGVSSGVSGEMSGGVSSGVSGEMSGEVSSGVMGGFSGGVLGGVEVHAADLDPVAVGCARRNLPGGHVHEGDLYEALPRDLRGRVDLLVVSPPYVPSASIGLLPPEARLHEPLVALDGGGDGLDVARRVIAGAPGWLAPGGHLLVETSERQAQAAADAMTRAGLTARIASSEEFDATAVIGTARP